MPIARDSKALFICRGHSGCSLSNNLALAIKTIEKKQLGQGCGFETIVLTGSYAIENET